MTEALINAEDLAGKFAFIQTGIAFDLDPSIAEAWLKRADGRHMMLQNIRRAGGDDVPWFYGRLSKWR